MASWLDYSSDTDFPIENLPFGVFSTAENSVHRIGVALGNFVVDVSVLATAGLLDGLGYSSYAILTKPTLNDFMALPRSAWRATRERLKILMTSTTPTLRDNTKLRSAAVVPMAQCIMHLPAQIGDYTDFYSSREHATNVGIMFRGAANALQPNWLHLPVGYHGRSSSVVISNTNVVRPCGQLQIDKDDPSKGSSYGPCRLLDFELEMAFFVGGTPNPLGKPITMAEVEDRIFGVVLMNDWSARDIQAWEYVPLGPFTAKNFATSISPWIVSLDALEPFHCSSSAGAVQAEPTPLDYLQDPAYSRSSYNVALQVTLQGAKDTAPSVISQSNLKYLYWNFKQQLVHHAVSGCPMLPGDLLGSGTISGSTTEPPSLGSMLELSWRGSRDVVLSNGADSENTRKFLKDGDTVVMAGWAESQSLGYRIGFGSVAGTVLPSSSAPSPSTAMTSNPQYTNFRLYSYWRSSSSYRVRIALNLKQVAYEYVPVDLAVLVGNTVNSLPAEYTQHVNTMEQVPTLECFDAVSGQTIRLTQSLAIMEFLDEVFPEQAPLNAGTTLQRARAREIAEIINSGIQPVQNLSMLRQIKSVTLVGGDGAECDSKELAKAAIAKGLTAIEKLASKNTPYVAGTFAPSVADVCLVPQMYNARRFGLDVDSLFPTLTAATAVLEALPAFKDASPELMPDCKA